MKVLTQVVNLVAVVGVRVCDSFVTADSLAIFTVRLQIGIVWSQFGVVEFKACCSCFAQLNYRLGSLAFRYAFPLINPYQQEALEKKAHAISEVMSNVAYKLAHEEGAQLVHGDVNVAKKMLDELSKRLEL